MAYKTTFVVQQFKMSRGRLVPGDREVAATDNGARKKAEAVAARVPGAAALMIIADDETGELGSAEVLGKWGQVPDDFEDQLKAG